MVLTGRHAPASIVNQRVAYWHCKQCLFVFCVNSRLFQIQIPAQPQTHSTIETFLALYMGEVIIICVREEVRSHSETKHGKGKEVGNQTRYNRLKHRYDR